MYFFKIFYLGIVSLIKFVIKFFKYFFIGLYNIITLIPKYFVLGIIYIFGKKEKKKISKQNKKISFAIVGTTFAIYLVCVFLISRWYVQGLKIKYLSNDIINSTDIIEKEDKDNNNQTVPEPEPEKPSDNTSENNAPVYYPNDYWDYMNVPFMEVNFTELLKKNPDTVGWIKVDGTKVNYLSYKQRIMIII